jgi:hypothetical protein
MPKPSAKADTRPWTKVEEEALRNAVTKYGESSWQAIVNDPAYAHELRNRSNIDCKDKWRNIKRADQYMEMPRRMQMVVEVREGEGGF